MQGIDGLKDLCRLALLALGAGNAGLDRAQVEALLTRLRPAGISPPSPADLAAAWREADADGDGRVGLDDLTQWAAARPAAVAAARAAVLGFADEAAFFGRPLAEVIAKPKPAVDKKPKRSLIAAACGTPVLAAAAGTAAAAALAAAALEALRRAWR